MRGLDRKSFLALGAALSAVAPSGAFAQTGAPAAAAAPARYGVDQALVLSGGGALGAYEAGVVETIADASGVADGQPLAPYGIVCGTSIGALNGYLVATAQYTKLRSLWSDISTQHVIRLKPKYRKVLEESSGVASRLAEQISMLNGLRTDVTGVLDGDHLREWLITYFDFSKPVVMPFVWAVTNLTLERPEYFYLAPTTATPAQRQVALAAARLALGPDTAVYEASRDLLVDQLRASAAFPVGFDPVRLPAPDGTMHDYVDGGVTANTPVRVATAIARRVDSVLLNPAFEPATIKNAVQVGSGAFDTMQRRLMEDAMRAAYFESFLLRALRDLPASYVSEIANLTGVSVDHLTVLMNDLYDTDLYVLRPGKTLPVNLFGFEDGDALAETYAMGKSDAAVGFQRFDPASRTVKPAR